MLLQPRKSFTSCSAGANKLNGTLKLSKGDLLRKRPQNGPTCHKLIIFSNHVKKKINKNKKVEKIKTSGEAAVSTRN